MNLMLRRGLVLVGVVASIVFAVLAIRVASQLTAAAAPPPAPPVSIAELQAGLAAEQARGALLQDELDELQGLTDELTVALSETSGQVSADGLTATSLRDRLDTAESKLARVKALLRRAQARLAELQAAANAAAAAGSSRRGGGGSTGGSGGASTPRPASGGGMTLALSLSGGEVRVAWSTCSAGSFAGYAVVRSSDSEIHWPPEDLDTEIARVSSRSTTATMDSSAPSGRTSWYRVYCLYQHDQDVDVANASPTQRVSVP